MNTVIHVAAASEDAIECVQTYANYLVKAGYAEYMSEPISFDKKLSFIIKSDEHALRMFEIYSIAHMDNLFVAKVN